MKNIRQFVDQLAAGESSEAKETLENALSNKAFSALDEYKKDIAQSIFGNKEETTETQEADTQVEVQETE